MVFNKSFASEKNMEALKYKLVKGLILKRQTLFKGLLTTRK